MFTQIGNVTIESQSDDGEFSEWGKLPKPLQDKLTEAVKMAPIMVADAIAALNGLLSNILAHQRRRVWHSGAFRRMAVERDPAPNGPVALDHTEAGQGLVKYFNLSSANTQYSRYITGIRGTFTIVLTNLEQPYKLILSDMEDSGRVLGNERRNNPQPVSPIRQRFGFKRQWDHKDYWPLTQGDIEISPVWVRDAPSAREIARTIVHEASHKWAFTTDVLYKHQSFAEIVSLRGIRKHLLTPAPPHPSQARFVIPGQPRFFLPMMGIEEKKPWDDPDVDVLITTERWLENADSYAWFARRMFKRRTVTFAGPQPAPVARRLF